MNDKHFEFQELEVSEIMFPVERGGDYQRDVDPGKVARIVRDYNPLRLGTPEVAFYVAPGDTQPHMWVWEGGNRVTSVLPRLGIRTVWCRVAYGYSYQEVALAFADQGVNRTAVGAKDEIRAKLRGESVTHEEGMAILGQYGYRLQLQRGTPGPSLNGWRCAGAIREILGHPGGLEVLKLTCSVLRESWGDCAPGNTMVLGLAHFIRAYQASAPSPAGERDYFRRGLVGILRDHDETGLLRRARGMDVKGPVEDKLRWVLRSCYNVGRRDKFRLFPGPSDAR